MTTPDRTKPASVKDPGNVPTIFVDGFHGIQLKDFVVRMNLVAEWFNPQGNGGNEHTVVARLNMPLSVFVRIHEAMGQFIKELEQAGAIQRVEEPTEGQHKE